MGIAGGLHNGSACACITVTPAYGDTVQEPDPQTQRPLFALLIRLCAALSLSIMLVFVKLAGESGIHVAETLFWRQMPTVPILVVWLAWTGSLATLRTSRLPIHARRAAYGLVGMLLNFLGVMLLPLAEATTFNFTSAFWAVILSALILHEKIGYYRWAAVALGFLGVLVIAQPGDGHIPLAGAAAALGGAFMIALISIQIRDLTRTEAPLTIVFYFSAFSIPVLALALTFVMTAHTPYQSVILAGLATFGLIGQLCLTAALRYGAVASVIVMDYSALLWATLFGWGVFDRLPPATTWLGAPLIVAAGLVVAWREHRLKRSSGVKEQATS
ncbi:DMT family transporter [Parerythrobacter aestuarii]|uniref:DMT family transporter n=1 Tax=Parerythrobacter aestuarii TaxID=3020909 RepID=UPI0024DE7586|nr:DMT family transporter [Parerythrobacter aestuarii]